MRLIEILRLEATAWLLGAVALAGLSALAYAQIGWLGIGIIGLFGLLISTRIDLHGGHALAESDFGSGDVPHYARQREVQRSQTSPEHKLALTAERQKRARLLYLVNTVFIAMTALGLGLFVLYQL